PYHSATITEFWRRWHISLSSWLRDYLYISLGGNRKGKLRTYLNLLITMLLGGLWHGAAIRFVLWGALHGVALALHKVWLSFVPGAKMLGKDMNPVMRLLGVVFTFHLVAFGWLIFRADSMQTVELMLHQIFTAFDLSLLPQLVEGYAASMLLIAVGYLLHLSPSRLDEWMRSGIIRTPMVMQVVLLVAVIWLVMQVKSADIQPFIYFQF
ncbi:MAG: MBOAT family protein, partial [Alistipes sp.]|nr:MBOAT family protein [Alistipes sp.]